MRSAFYGPVTLRESANIEQSLKLDYLPVRRRQSENEQKGINKAEPKSARRTSIIAPAAKRTHQNDNCRACQ
jgi:hypothetical protein